VKLRGRKSLTQRLTVLFALVSTTVLLLLGLIVAGLVEHHFEELDAEVLKGNLTFLQHALQKVSSSQELDVLPQQLEDALVGHPGLAVIVLAPDGRTLFSTGRAEFPDTLLARRTVETDRPTIWTTSDQHHYRGLADKARTNIAGAPPALVAAATDMGRHEHFMNSFQIALWLVVGFAALLTGFLGWIAARRGLAPLKTIRQSAAGITANRLNHRLSAASIPDELVEVVETLNEMLARLQESFRRLSNFSSDLAHELRTPVSNLLTQTQVILSKPRTPEEYRDILASNGEEFERLARMISDMLFLAKSDNDLIIPNREKIDLRREVEDVFEFYDALAAEKDIRLTLTGSCLVSGDKLMLRRAISNLLSNAIRHTPPAGRIAVQISEADDSAVTLSVENTGETIAPEHLPRLFDRFYRVHSSRQRFAEGAGLGLAITRSIVRAHGGEVSVTSEDGVTRFGLRIPAQQGTP
jgi:two-component system heavy metal sensor histidine kinase CusS